MKSAPLDVRGQLLRNSLLNLVGQAVPLVAGVAALPLVLHRLGPDRFGVLSLALVALGQLAILDLGLGRALTKAVAEQIQRAATADIPRLVWTSVALQAAGGLLAGGLLAAVAPLVVDHVFVMPPALRSEARLAAYLLALAVPVVAASGAFRGLIEGAGRFDLLNAVAAPIGVATYLLPLGILVGGGGLPGIIASLVGLRLSVLLVLGLVGLHLFPGLRCVTVSPAAAITLLAFGGWVTVSNVAAIVLTHSDRFLIAALLPVAMVSYYAAPYELVTRLWIVSASVVVALFPAASAIDPGADRARLRRLLADTVWGLFLVLLPAVLALSLFAQEILRLWLGEAYAAPGAIVVRLLAAGLLVNSLAQAPHAILQASGRPDIPAKLHVVQVPLYWALAWWLIGAHGITGAAVAWLARVSVDAGLMFGAAYRLGVVPLPFRAPAQTRPPACSSSPPAGNAPRLRP